MTEPVTPQDHQKPAVDDETAEPVEEAPNRAARRAQNKKGSATAAQYPGQQQRFHGRGNVQSPRQYGNRRSG